VKLRQEILRTLNRPGHQLREKENIERHVLRVALRQGAGESAPERLAQQTECGALVYSRAGYGKSDPVELPRPVSFMHEEALTTLPQVLDAFAIREAIIVGHSDGGSISIIHAGGTLLEHVSGSTIHVGARLPAFLIV